MRKALAIAAAVGAFLALTAARPGTEFQLFTNLNGEEVRWTLPDGGQSGIFGGSSGTACMPVSGLPAAANNVVEIVPLVSINMCERCSTCLVAGARWDGGCGTDQGDVNFGVPLQPFQPKFVVLKSSTTHLCASSDAGSINAPVFSLQ